MDDQVKANVLAIVLSYLYSRRPQQAWSELAGLWPPTEVTNMKARILAIRKQGILRRAVTAQAR